MVMIFELQRMLITRRKCGGIAPFTGPLGILVNIIRSSFLLRLLAGRFLPVRAWGKVAWGGRFYTQMVRNKFSPGCCIGFILWRIQFLSISAEKSVDGVMLAALLEA